MLKPENKKLKKFQHKEKALSETAVLRVLKKKFTKLGETTRATYNERGPTGNSDIDR